MSAPFHKLRGWVEVIEHEETAGPRFHVYDWTEDFDSGQSVGDFAARNDAVAFAVNWAVTYGRKLQTPEVAHLAARMEGGAA